ncbi:dihydrofolate reductase family protein [Hymenobacter sp.]|uniref:dihydrofolate reductase family protein n=1 Tax=Hymenobacter sp. TaxID=1898978 RepID=UPI00286ABC74|nr:dihydrofolate reductase family protein [Hymenobacter sp.]
MRSSRRVFLFIAASVDGFIARPDGGIDWLARVETEGEDYGYARFIEQVDTVIMGRHTYDTVLGFGLPFPHLGRTCYVLSRTRTGADDNVRYYAGHPAELVQELRQRPGKHIFLDGGAQALAAFMAQDLVDDYIVSTIPVLLGEGIPLFSGRQAQELPLQLVSSTAYASGLVQRHYQRVRS